MGKEWVLFFAGIGSTAMLGLITYFYKRHETFVDKLRAEADQAKATLMEKSINETHLNTLAIVELKTKIEFLLDSFKTVQRIKEDVNELHGLRRRLKIPTEKPNENGDGNH